MLSYDVVYPDPLPPELVGTEFDDMQGVDLDLWRVGVRKEGDCVCINLYSYSEYTVKDKYIKCRDRWFDIFTGTTYEGRIRNTIQKYQRVADEMNEQDFKVRMVSEKAEAALND